MNPFFLSLLLCTLLFFSGCGQKTEDLQPELRPVRHEILTLQSLSETRTFTGQARPASEIRLGFRIAGQIVDLPVKMGDAVMQGQLIARLDDRDDRLSLSELQAVLENTKAQRNTAAAALERVRSLYARDNVALSEYETAKSRYAAAAADYEATLQRIALQESRLSYASLLSPAAGRIASVNAENNENVQAGATVVTLSTDDAMLVRAGVPEAYISRIHPGDPVALRFSALPERRFTGRVYEVSYVSDAQSTYPVTVRIQEPDSRIRPGMPAEVTFHMSDDLHEKHILVPLFAVMEDPEGRFVWVLLPGEREGTAVIHRRPVTLGDLIGERMVVTEGLKAGERVVTAGVSRLAEGMVVRHENPEATP
ncbi:efflux RND transporter periplasmic adaptor subunit [Desulfobotulus sp.]|jgi:RND family efflux transporter MFP subunit|uniref:efflux RND transporter periplasmic adaptor subunit n=1 Tax=Desulfobotulus sp. TaxID=1940337 RepID=UPI002A3627F4|nr:efflux RND transporter periplasmic adaptor subunit [Desulfobotulus sp.]MDY0164545.1 efflux RND transporter periplasmic adaptor subunit [Desulfobotulus sp.]